MCVLLDVFTPRRIIVTCICKGFCIIAYHVSGACVCVIISPLKKSPLKLLVYLERDSVKRALCECVGTLMHTNRFLLCAVLSCCRAWGSSQSLPSPVHSANLRWRAPMEAVVKRATKSRWKRVLTDCALAFTPRTDSLLLQHNYRQ